jgi:hypothetical protein
LSELLDKIIADVSQFKQVKIELDDAGANGCCRPRWA